MRRHGADLQPGRPLRRGRRRGPSAAGLVTLVVFGCGPSPDDPLPPTDDLYAYSLAVAEKARLKAPGLETRALYNLGQVHERFGFEDRAIEEYEKAIETDRNFGAAYRRIGFILSQRGNRMNEAIESYQQALRCDPGATGINTRLGLIFLHQDRPEEAVQAFAQEVSQKTATAETYYHLGQAYGKQGRTAESVQAFRDALERDPDMRSACYSLAGALRSAGDTAGADAALARFRELKSLEDAAAARPKRAGVDREAGQRFAAETWLDAGDLFHRAAYSAAGSDTPEEKEAARKRALAFDEDSVNALEKALRLDATYEEAWDTYLKLRETRGRLDAALRFAEENRRAAPSSGLWPLRCALVRKRLARGGDSTERHHREVLDLLNAAIANAPDLAAAHYEMAQTILMEMNPPDADLVPRALEHAKTAVDLEPSPLHYDILALAYHRSGLVDLARRSLEEGIRRNPGAPNLVRRLEMLRKTLEPSR